MPSLFANDIGGIGAALQADRSRRDALSQAAISRLIQANQEAERKREWELNHAQQVKSAADTLALNQQQLALQRDNALAAALRFKQEMAFKEKEFNEYSLPSLQQSKDERVKAAADKLAAERKRSLADSLVTLVNEDQPFDPQAFADVPPEVRDPLLTVAASRRRQQAEEVQRAQQAALFANRFKLIEKHAADLKKSDVAMPTGSGVNVLGVFGNKINPGYDGGGQAKQLTDRLETFRTQFGAVTDPQTGLVEVDPQTGNFIPKRTLLRPWMTGANAPATNFNWNRGNSFAQAMPNATATQGDTSEAQPMVPNRATPPMTMTTTNRPRFVRQNGVVFQLVPDGSYQPVTQ